MKSFIEITEGWKFPRNAPDCDNTKVWLDWIVNGEDNPASLEATGKTHLKFQKSKSRADRPNVVCFIAPKGGTTYTLAQAKALFEPMGIEVTEIEYKMQPGGQYHDEDSLAYAVTSAHHVFKLAWSRNDWVLFKSGLKIQKPGTKKKTQTTDEEDKRIGLGGTALRPQSLGIPCDEELTMRQMMKYTKAGIKKLNLPPEHTKCLITIAERCSTTEGWGDIDTSDLKVKELFDDQAIRNIGKDFAEVLGGICLITAGFDTCSFPCATNYPIADFFVSKPSKGVIKQFVSAKTGGGSATAFSGFHAALQMQDFLSATGSIEDNSVFQDRPGSRETSRKEKELLKIFDRIIGNKAWTEPLEIAKDLNTAYCVALAKMMGKKVSQLTLPLIAEWVLLHKSPEELDTSLTTLRTQSGIGGKGIAKNRLKSALNGTAPEGVVNISLTNQLAKHISTEYRNELKLVLGRLNAWQYNADWNRDKTQIIQSVKVFRHMDWKVKMAGNSKEFQNKIAFVKEGVHTFKEWEIINEII
tara:strand:+ start:649 stop:2226 length:1578 start_codon:yes stop_codon:yes gene_type:complete